MYGLILQLKLFSQYAMKLTFDLALYLDLAKFKINYLRISIFTCVLLMSKYFKNYALKEIINKNWQ